MSTKDYYRILSVKPAASLAQIKNAYRRLAMKYHPDRNPHDELAAIVFAEVAEAYKVLSNPETRRQYNYQRYYTAVQEYSQPAESIETLLFKALQLKKQVSVADPYRFNTDALLYSIRQLLPADIDLLLKTDPVLSKQFLENIVVCCNKLESVQTDTLLHLLDPLFMQHAWLQEQIENLKRQQQKKERWEKYKVVLVIFIAIVLCFLIFLSGK